MKPFNIYLTGVGGQGIGLISEIILRAADHDGLPVIGVDTHGLAQRGGIVVSQIRIGEPAFAPIIPAGHADLVVSLEANEALRAAATLRDGGALVYYETSWQPLDVRLGKEKETQKEDLAGYCRSRKITAHPVYQVDLPEARMQNIAILREIDRHNLVPGIGRAAYRRAMEDLMAGGMLEKNLALFEALD